MGDEYYFWADDIIHHWQLTTPQMNFFRYINIAAKVYSEIKVQRQFSKTFLIPYLGELQKKYNGTFQPEQSG